MQARVAYATGSSVVWRDVFGRELLLERALARGSFSGDGLDGATSLLDDYRGVRRFERCLRWAEETGVRPLLVGEAPNGRETPFSGPSGARLARLLRVDPLPALFDVANLLTDDEAAEGAGVALLRARAGALDTRRRVVLVAGRTAADGFGLGDAPFLTWRVVRKAAVMVVPHPSGRCRWWNDPDAERSAERALGPVGARLLATVTTDVSASRNGSCRGNDGHVESETEDHDAVQKLYRTTLPDEYAEALERLCAEEAISSAAYIRRAVVQDVRERAEALAKKKPPPRRNGG
jgi:uracil-DNA glycosylase